jgi:hypothetical protein
MLAFTGHRETLSLESPQNSGNLTDLVTLLSKYDPQLWENVHCIHENSTKDYWSHEIQNELKELMASKVKKTEENQMC